MSSEQLTIARLYPPGSEHKEIQAGKGTLVFQSSSFDPLGEIPFLGILQSQYPVENLVLDSGEFLFDYRKKSATA